MSDLREGARILCMMLVHELHVAHPTCEQERAMSAHQRHVARITTVAHRRHGERMRCCIAMSVWHCGCASWCFSRAPKCIGRYQAQSEAPHILLDGLPDRQVRRRPCRARPHHSLYVVHEILPSVAPAKSRIHIVAHRPDVEHIIWAAPWYTTYKKQKNRKQKNKK